MSSVEITRAEAQENSNEAGAERPLRVLVVDDDVAVGKLLTAILESMGRDRLTINRLESAFAAMEVIQRGVRPDGIFSDMVMPKMSGKGFYDWLKKEHPELAVQFWLATGIGEVPELMDFPESQRLQKPFRFAQVRNAVGAILMGRRSAR